MGAGEKKNLTEHFACGGTWGRVCIQGGGLGALPQKILKSRRSGAFWGPGGIYFYTEIQSQSSSFDRPLLPNKNWLLPIQNSNGGGGGEYKIWISRQMNSLYKGGKWQQDKTFVMYWFRVDFADNTDSTELFSIISSQTIEYALYLTEIRHFQVVCLELFVVKLADLSDDAA